MTPANISLSPEDADFTVAQAIRTQAFWCISLGHSLIMEQCRRGQGYPVAISEAHEQAVINGADRQLFKQMITEVLERQGLPTYSSEKERAKRSPWV